MAKPVSQPGPAGDIDADLRRLDVGIRQLKVQYDMFFAGALKREPFELRSEIDRIIKRHANSPIQKYAQRFHLNTLISRFNSLSELWGKTMRTREEGDRPPPALADREGPREQLVARCRFHDAKTNQTELHRLYDRFVETRRRLDAGKRVVSFEKFAAGVTGQSQRLQKQSGCAEIELRVVVHDHKVLVKARPGR
jgi:hypothetical protein